MADSNPSFYSDVPISVPVVLPSAEEYDMSGFSWSSNYGLLIKMNRDGDPVADILKDIKNNQRYTGRKDI